MILSTKSYKGARDIYPEDMRLRRYIFDTWTWVCESYGYERYDAPIIEPVELFAAKSGEEIVNDQTYTFTDRGGRKVTIRPEMTPSVARMVAARRQETPYPARLYSISNFMRYEKPQNGREREFWQLNVDLFGASDIEADAEIIAVSDAILKKFGASEQMYSIRINDRKLINYLMREYLGLDEKKALGMIKLFDRFAKIAKEDFNLQAMEIMGSSDASKVIGLIDVASIDELPESVKNSEFLDDILAVSQKLLDRGVKVEFDVTLMRGFDYYTGIVFEVFDKNPANNRAMFGGGRYDGLVGLFGVEDLPVVGVAPGETTMIEFLKAWDLIPKLKPATDIYVIPIEVDASKVTSELRAKGMNVAVDISDRKMNKKIRAAVKLGVPYVLFVGEEEIKSGKFKLKNLETQEEKFLAIDEIVKVKQ